MHTCYGRCMDTEKQLPEQVPLLTEVLTLSDEALIAFVDCIRLNAPRLTRDPNIVRRIFAAYFASDTERVCQETHTGAWEDHCTQPLGHPSETAHVDARGHRWWDR